MAKYRRGGGRRIPQKLHSLETPQKCLYWRRRGTSLANYIVVNWSLMIFKHGRCRQLALP